MYFPELQNAKRGEDEFDWSLNLIVTSHLLVRSLDDTTFKVGGSLCSSHDKTFSFVIGSLAVIFISNYMTGLGQEVNHYTVLP